MQKLTWIHDLWTGKYARTGCHKVLLDPRHQIVRLRSDCGGENRRVMGLNERREAQDIPLRRVRDENRGEGFEVIPEIDQAFRKLCSNVSVYLYNYLTRDNNLYKANFSESQNFAGCSF